MKKISDVYNNVETFDIVRRNQTLLRLKGDDINGKNVAQMEEILGDKLGEGTYNFSIKHFGEHKKKVGKIRGVIQNKSPKERVKENMDSILLNEKINKLDQSIEKLIKNNGGADYKQVLELQKTTFEIQLDFYKTQNIMLAEKIDKLEEKIESFEKEDNSSGGINQILGLIPMFLNKSKIGAASLKDNVSSDPSDIPGEFIEALGKVDYSKVSEEQKNKILGYFNLFSNQLPLKQG